MKAVGRNIEKDNEIQVLTKRILNLSKFLESEALRRSKGRLCEIQTIIDLRKGEVL